MREQASKKPHLSSPPLRANKSEALGLGWETCSLKQFPEYSRTGVARKQIWRSPALLHSQAWELLWWLKW